MTRHQSLVFSVMSLGINSDGDEASESPEIYPRGDRRTAWESAAALWRSSGSPRMSSSLAVAEPLRTFASLIRRWLSTTTSRKFVRRPHSVRRYPGVFAAWMSHGEAAPIIGDTGLICGILLIGTDLPRAELLHGSYRAAAGSRLEGFCARGEAGR